MAVEVLTLTLHWGLRECILFTGRGVCGEGGLTDGTWMVWIRRACHQEGRGWGLFGPELWDGTGSLDTRLGVLGSDLLLSGSLTLHAWFVAQLGSSLPERAGSPQPA